jgi:hypothetical protein
MSFMGRSPSIQNIQAILHLQKQKRRRRPASSFTRE